MLINRFFFEKLLNIFIFTAVKKIKTIRQIPIKYMIENQNWFGLFQAQKRFRFFFSFESEISFVFQVSSL